MCAHIHTQPMHCILSMYTHGDIGGVFMYYFRWETHEVKKYKVLKIIPNVLF